MVNIGIVGIGYMGVTHFKAIEQVKGGKVYAIASRDPQKRRGDWRSIQGNFGGGGGMQDLSKVIGYETFDQLLDDPKVDLVDICLPTHLHTAASLQALEADKHVLLEKPIALELKDADRIISLAEKRGCQFMVAHVLRFFPEFRLIKELVEGERYGAVLAARFRRIISRPAWWGAEDLRRTGGPAIDLHIHDTDFIQWVFGMPRAVVSIGYLGSSATIEHIDTHYHYGDAGPVVTAEGGWLAQQGCPFEHGYDLYLERATLKFNSSSGLPPQLLTLDGKVSQPRLSGRDGFVEELQEAVKAVGSGRPSRVLSGASARDSLALCLKEIQSAKTGRRVGIPARSRIR